MGTVIKLMGKPGKSLLIKMLKGKIFYNE